SSSAYSPSGTPPGAAPLSAGRPDWSAGMADRGDVEVQRTGPQRPLVDLRALVTRRPHAGQHGRVLVRVGRARQVGRAELDPPEIAEVPHPQFGVAAPLQARLGPVHLG